jgi:predicted RNA-binding Zn ribbon-like protein
MPRSAGERSSGPTGHSFHRGALALDFVGTVGARTSARPVERLGDARALRAWLQQAELLPTDGPTPTPAEYLRAVDLREAIARLGNALVDHQQPCPRDLAVINETAAMLAAGVPYLDAVDLVERWTTEQPVPFALARVAASAIQVFGGDRDRLVRCQAEGCGALLISRARNEPRRWCSMTTCGNRAKVAAFRTRTKRDPASS